MTGHPCQTCKHFIQKPTQSTKTNRGKLYPNINPQARCINHKEKSCKK